jgi:hypothetical protein
MGGSKSILKENSFKFAILIIKHYKCLIETKNEYILNKQLLRSTQPITHNP